MKSSLTFQIHGDTAVGTLHSGKQFLIDSADVELVSSLSWRVNKDGYLAHYDHNTVRETLLHRMLMGVKDPRVYIDHINRDRMDYRRCNLRTVSPSQNSANHGIFRTNKTGYTGVYFSRVSGRYEVKVGYNNRRILLGTTRAEEELPLLAQMYNIGARFFFEDFAGAMNNVPDPPDDLIQQITEKCRKYKKAPTAAGASAA